MCDPKQVMTLLNGKDTFTSYYTDEDGQRRVFFELIKKSKVEYSENSNGIFFDLLKVTEDVFQELVLYLEFCKKIRAEQSIRDEDERIAQENIQ
jgi:hypothetical protein